MKEILVDKDSQEYVDSVFTNISNIQVDFNITEAISPDFLRERSITKNGAKEYLLNPPLKQKYDLLVVKDDNFETFIPFMHRALFIFVTGATNDSKTYIPYTKVNDCFEGILYLNDFHSMTFPNTRLSVYEQTYVRDKPYRFLKKVSGFAESFNWKVIVEIGSSRTPVKHPLDEINPHCCNDSHSTFFWCRTKCLVHTVDVNPACERVLEQGYEDGMLSINGKLEIHIEDGIQFLEEYEGEPIDLLFLDAWDVIPGTDYAEKHLEAYEKAKAHLANDVFISIDDTDILNGKGKLLVPVLLDDGFIILYRGRHTVLYRGSLEKLFRE